MKLPQLFQSSRLCALSVLLLLPACQTTIVPGPVAPGQVPPPKPTVVQQPIKKPVGALQPIPAPPKPPAQPLIPLKPEGQDSLSQDKPETPLYQR